MSRHARDDRVPRCPPHRAAAARRDRRQRRPGRSRRRRRSRRRAGVGARRRGGTRRVRRRAGNPSPLFRPAQRLHAAAHRQFDDRDARRDGAPAGGRPARCTRKGATPRTASHEPPPAMKYTVDPDITRAATLDSAFYADEAAYADDARAHLRAERGSGWATSPTCRSQERSRRATCCRACSTSRCCWRATAAGRCAACRTSARTAATSWCRSRAAPTTSAAATTRGASTSPGA